MAPQSGHREVTAAEERQRDALPDRVNSLLSGLDVEQAKQRQLHAAAGSGALPLPDRLGWGQAELPRPLAFSARLCG